MTGLPNIGDIITKRRHTLFGHVVRLDATTPAHQALEQVVATKAGHCPGTITGEDLRGVPGGHGYSRSAREPQPVGWQNAEERGHRGESSQRTTAVYAS